MECRSMGIGPHNARENESKAEHRGWDDGGESKFKRMGLEMGLREVDGRPEEGTPLIAA